MSAGFVASGPRRFPAEPGRTLFDHADRLELRVPTSCDRHGTCHECVVEVFRGGDDLTPRTEAESFLRDPYRLACQAVVATAGAGVEFAPLARRPQILTAAAPAPVDLDPIVTRSGGKVLYDGEAIDEERGRLLGVAADVGTTTIVLELVDLESGVSLVTSAFENPQRFGGSDVMHRISYDGGPGRGELHKSVIGAVNRELGRMCKAAGADRLEIYEIVVVGNPTMRDLFFGLDVQSIGQRPYKSIVEHEFRSGTRTTTALVERAHRLRLLAHPQARVFGGPLVASHVGADAAADLLATAMGPGGEAAMLVDVGTNTEVVVAANGRLVAASCPAGPAFEGGLVRYGMPGCDGAIEALWLEDGAWRYRTIGDLPPQGICGSGLIDFLAEARRAGLMAPKGVFAGKARELVVAPEQGIGCSREDVSQLAQAKSANYCGQLIVLRHCGVRPGDLSRLYLAGGFANYINIRNAIEIGFLAPVPEARIVKTGNASLAGARQMLVSRQRRRAAEELVRQVEHVELETTPDFFELFVDGCQFQPMPSEIAV